MKTCEECGKEIKETARTCPACGVDTDLEAAGRNEVVALAERAMGGDDSAWGDIYEKTHRYVYYLALKTLRNDQDAQDITQEVFIKAIDSIEQLNSAGSFFGWLRSIIFSKCMDLIKKKKPVLLEDGEGGGSPLDDMPETDEDFLPERVLDNTETSRMILELVDDLPLQQRQTVLYYYYDEMTVDQIAALMECASGTVKSRLNYARQSIKKGVEGHERKGVKLYGMGALPILTILLRGQARAMLIPEALSRGLSAIIGTAAGSSAAGTATVGAATGTAAAGSTAGGTTGAAATGIGATVAGKVIIGVIVTAFVATGAVLVPRLVRTKPEESPPQALTETVAVTQEAAQQPTNETESPAIPEASTSTPEDIQLPEDDTQATRLDIILTAEQLAFLEPLEKALLAMDYKEVYRVQSSEDFKTLCTDAVVYNMPNVYKFNQDSAWSLGYYNYEYSSYRIRNSPLWDSDGRVIISDYQGGDDNSLYLVDLNIDDGKVNGAYKEIRYGQYAGIFVSSGTALDGLKHGAETVEHMFGYDSQEEKKIFNFIYENGKITNYRAEVDEDSVHYVVDSEDGSTVHYIGDPDWVHQIWQY